MFFTGQRIRWMNDPQLGPSIEVSQERAVEELEANPVKKNTKEDVHCTLAMHTRCRSLLGQIYWLQSRTRFQCCCKFFPDVRQKQLAPTIGDVKALIVRGNLFTTT